MPQLDDRIAAVTRAAQGIGKAIAETLARRGAHVVVADLTFEKAQATAQEIAASTGRRVLAVHLNVADSAICTGGGLVFLLTTQMIPAGMLLLPLFIMLVKLQMISTSLGLISRSTRRWQGTPW